MAARRARLFADATLNWRVVAAGVATAFLLPLGFAIVPALQSWRPDSADLKDGGRALGGGPVQRTRRVLVAVQVGLALVLLVQISLLARTAWNFRTLENGFDPRGVLTFRVDLSEPRYADAERITQFYRALLTRIDSLPGVVSSAAINRLPVADRELSARHQGRRQRAPSQNDALPFTAVATVSRATSTRCGFLCGAAVASATLTSAAIRRASPSSARMRPESSGPGRDPIGARATIVGPGMPDAPLQVVGVVANVRRSDIDRRTMPLVYVPSTWRPERTMAIVVRTDAVDPLGSVPAIRAQAAALAPNEPLFAVASMEQVLFNDVASMYTMAGLLGAIAVIALVLAGVGIYGVVSYMVTQRTREIGLRMALGAQPRAMLRMVIHQAARPVAAGGLLGAPAALALVYAMSGFFATVDVKDPTNYIGVAFSISLVALVASYVPARRAARIDPLDALRQD